MTIALRIEQSDFNQTEVRDTVVYALRIETEQAKVRRDYYADTCQSFEEKHRLSSDDFLARFERGELGDDAIFFDWYAAKRGFDLWSRRYEILSEVSL